MRFVVTGTGRSGTRWASEVLGVGHQSIFTGDGVVMPDLKDRAQDHLAGDAVGDCSFWAASQDLTGWRVILLVRDPRYVVGSWLATGEFDRMLRGYWRLWQHCDRLDPSILETDEQGRIERYWAIVNYQMARRADVVLRLEDCTPEVLGDACGVVPYRDVPPPSSFTKPVPIGEREVRELAREFGYDC